MALIRHSNWPRLGGSLLSDFFDDDRFSPPMSRSNLPAVNVKETDKAFEVEVAAPGFNKKDFNISVENGLLMVSAESKHENQTSEENYTRREFGYTSFARSFSLPNNTNEEDIKARYEEGILKLTIAKNDQEESKFKKAIEVK